MGSRKINGSYTGRLLFVLVAAATFFSISSAAAFSEGTEAGRRMLKTKSGEEALTAAIYRVNNLTVGNLDVSKPLYKLTLTQDVRLTQPLPELAGYAYLEIKGACKTAAGKIRGCVIDGQSKYSIFRSRLGLPAGIHLSNLVVQNALDGVVAGRFTARARNCVFQNNVASARPGGAVFRLTSATLKDTLDGLAETGREKAPLELVSCTFLHNRALAGSGGAVYVAGKLASIHIAKSVFQGNEAASAGGALSLGAAKLTCRDSVFAANTAKQSGGAIQYAGFNDISVIRSSFLNNTSTGSNGGAVSLHATGADAAVATSRFCSNTFRDNKSKKHSFVSRDIYLDSGAAQDAWKDSKARLSLCSNLGGNAFVQTASAKQFVTDKDCTGCSGCKNDCNKKGKCVLDSDERASCKCTAQYDPLSDCAACRPGSLKASKCTACERGFLKQKTGSCKACAGLSTALEYPPTNPLHGINTYTSAKSAGECKEKCNNRGKKFGSPDSYCNFWAYFGKDSEKGCASSCVLANYDLVCANGPIRVDAKHGLTYQYQEKGVSPNCSSFDTSS